MKISRHEKWMAAGSTLGTYDAIEDPNSPKLGTKIAAAVKAFLVSAFNRNGTTFEQAYFKCINAKLNPDVSRLSAQFFGLPRS